MIVRRIRVSVEPGIFSMERWAAFEVNGQSYNLIVDAESLKGDELEVHVVADRGEDAIVDLPRETMTTSNRILVPKTMLLPA